MTDKATGMAKGLVRDYRSLGGAENPATPGGSLRLLD
jgi:hypothetical protein